jgi:outer membrane immunogenic protein
MTRIIITITIIMFFLTSAAIAQESRSEIGLSGIGFFTQKASGEGLSRRATSTGGLLAPYRFRISSWLSVEAAYGYGRNTQKFYTSNLIYAVQSNVHQISAGFVVNLSTFTRWKISPYILTEGGSLTFSPTGTYYGTFQGSSERETKGMFVYGAGIRYPFSQHLSFRTEFRGLVYSPPTFNVPSLNMGTLTHTAQPSIGITYRF